MTYQYRHPLADGAVHGIEMPNANHLELVEGAGIFSVLAFKGQADGVEAALKAQPGLSPRKVGPGEWLVTTSERSAGLGEIADAMVVDQSHGRTLFRLKGPQAVRILMKGVGVDLPGGALPIGKSAMMAFQHLTVNLARTGDDAFELIVLRSFAESLYHDLRLAGREFSLSFAVADH
ncbi:sarcosine oxidase subunit gamma family protein [Rhizobium sp. FKL33]|uniref:sarcosine oxidase subunit gamma n=1 Tax=Rhizobium sp. FKL33 TaxID=2562307 RepID=UPI0010C0573F|nr:sarcosine oxidase subunit gamma family protein [Rhizobium sp. FKL33]